MTIVLLFAGYAPPEVVKGPIISLRHPGRDDRSTAEVSRELDRREGVADRDPA